MNETAPAPLFDHVLEQAVLAGFLIYPEEIIKYRQLSESTFTHFVYKQVYKVMRTMAEAGEEIDVITMRQKNPELKASDICGLNVLPKEYDSVWITPKKLPGYIKSLTDLEIRRTAYEGGDAQIISDKLQRLSYTGKDKFLTNQEASIWFTEEYKLGTMRKNGIPYPFRLLNYCTKGIHPAQLVVVGARPSVGKSTFLQNLAVEANRHEVGVLFGTAEMSITMTIQRVLSQLLGKNMFDDDGEIDPEVIKSTLDLSPIFYHSFSSTIELEERVKENRKDIGMVLVDYIQIIEPRGKYKSQFEKTGMVVNDLVQIKNKYDIPIIAASQFNRNAADEQPSMADFYESGKIEQAADVILSLWQHEDDVIASDDKMRRVRIDLLKNRNGKTFRNIYKGRDNLDNQEFVLYFQKEKFEFTEPSENIFKYPEPEPKQIGLDKVVTP